MLDPGNVPIGIGPALLELAVESLCQGSSVTHVKMSAKCQGDPEPSA